MRRARRTLTLGAGITGLALTATSPAHATSYCGKIRTLKVYSSHVACSTALPYIRAYRCPRGWKTYRIYQEFDFEASGWGCRKGTSRFWAE